VITLAWLVLHGAYAFCVVWGLKTWVVEPYVHPTGSMADTMRGYHKQIRCPSCGYEFAVNSSIEADPQPELGRQFVNGCTCPNCRRVIRLVDRKRDDRAPRDGVLREDETEFEEVADPGWDSGDRFLVGKRLLGGLSPGRLDLIVFDYPERQNEGFLYIKRLIGLSGETVAISGGDLFVLSPSKGPTYDDSHVAAEDRWQSEHMHANDEAALKHFTDGAFEIIRKPPEGLLSMRRLVYDNDHQANDLTGKQWQRWRPDSDAWDAEDDGKAFRHTGGEKGNNTNWLRYRHLLRKEHGKPTLITDFMGYNSNESWEWRPQLNQWSPASKDTPSSRNGSNWVGDLILECEVKIDKAEGELVLELVRGPDRFRARWDLASEDGVCTLTRQPVKGPEDSAEELDRQPTRLRKGTYRLRFANVDRRLTVWVDNQLPFGAGMPYDPPTFVGPTEADLQPASIGVKGGALTVRKLKLWRDTYHTVAPQSKGGDVQPGDWGDPKTWSGFQQPPVLTLYVQPGHYLCLGDNSPWSSDGRTWGLVPERLLLGRALLVYYPFDRAGRIR